MDEIERIKNTYQDRKTDLSVIRTSQNYYFKFFSSTERELKYLEILKKLFGCDLSGVSLIEIGAGGGYNLSFFNRMGIPWKAISANELLEDRIEILKNNFPLCKIYEGNALDINIENKFDVVFQSTVFTSILDPNLKKQLANKMLDIIKPGGIVLWYDFKYNNPSNKSVKGVTKSEIKSLFGRETKIKFYNVTLAPPIGRRVGKLYSLINFLFPFLRTHLIATIHKPIY